MKKAKLCLGISQSWGMELTDLIKLLKKVGFDGFFVEWYKGLDMESLKRTANEVGLEFQSIHAPYVNSHLMWENGEESKKAVNELLECLEDCHKYGVPIMVCHAIIGFDRHTPNDTGVSNFKTVAEKSKEYGITLAIENTEGEEYLDCLMNAFLGWDNVGFCWDTGHELCYNRGRDLLADYGYRLVCTHINDNLGITDINNIFWTDDLHLLPFDGIVNWQGAVNRLKSCNYQGDITFELNKKSKPNRHENDAYDKMTTEEYVKEIYARACKIAHMLEENK